MIRRGFTLAEVVVASSVGLLLVGLVSSIFILASQGWNKTSRLQTAQQSTLVAVTRLREDFRRSRRSATIQGPVLSFLSFDDGSGSTAWDTTGTIFWKCWVQYRWKEGVLERRQSSTAAPATEVSDHASAWLMTNPPAS
ncbi:MAG: prepilin-type N-terminal cleavage/methylation domain-containing protein [Vulcanimicrobiota bacterium]